MEHTLLYTPLDTYPLVTYPPDTYPLGHNYTLRICTPHTLKFPVLLMHHNYVDCILHMFYSDFIYKAVR